MQIKDYLNMIRMGKDVAFAIMQKLEKGTK